MKGDRPTVYASLPPPRRSAPAARARGGGSAARARRRGGRAGELRIRLRTLDSRRAGRRRWIPELVSANAERAAEDPRAIAYLGELDYGASAVSVPITNEAGLLQVSPARRADEPHQRPPGRPRAGPERYYPTGERNFVRLAPSDLLQAEDCSSWCASAAPSGSPWSSTGGLRPRARGPDRRARAPRRARAGRGRGVPRATSRRSRTSPTASPRRARRGGLRGGRRPRHGPHARGDRRAHARRPGLRHERDARARSARPIPARAAERRGAHAVRAASELPAAGALMRRAALRARRRRGPRLSTATRRCA